MYKEKKDKDAKRENIDSKNFLKLQSTQIDQTSPWQKYTPEESESISAKC